PLGPVDARLIDRPVLTALPPSSRIPRRPGDAVVDRGLFARDLVSGVRQFRIMPVDVLFHTSYPWARPHSIQDWMTSRKSLATLGSAGFLLVISRRTQNRWDGLRARSARMRGMAGSPIATSWR